MKAKLIKELHAMGVYRDLTTKKKLECMKLVDIMNLRAFIMEEKARGVEFAKKQCDYVFIEPPTKKEKTLGKKKR